jgi:uncharacterized protein YbcI
MVAEITKAGLEADIARVVSRFHEDQNGCKPDKVIVNLADDMVVVRSTGCFTPTERQLATSQEGRKFVKSARAEQRSLSRKDVSAQVADILRVSVVRSFWDLDVRVGEQIEVYILEQAPEL